MSAPYPHDYHPLAPLVRQLRGTLAWYQETGKPLDRTEFDALMARCRALQSQGAHRGSRLKGPDHTLMRSAYWVDVPRAAQASGTQPFDSSLLSHQADQSTALRGQEVAEQAKPSGPLPASELPAVTHERHVVPSISFSEPPPRDYDAPGSAELMRPSVSLLKHRGLIGDPSVKTRESEAQGGEAQEVKLEAHQASGHQAGGHQVGGAPAWGQRPAPSLSSSGTHQGAAHSPSTSPSASPSADTESGASRDARGQLWVNQPSSRAQNTDGESHNTPARSSKLGASLAILTQRTPVVRSTDEGRSVTARDVTSPAKSLVVKPCGFEEDERYAAICERVRECQRCPRGAAPRITGGGHYGARFMFVIGTPSDEELRIGQPLMAQPERELFHQILKAISLSRLDVYITSLFKCGAAFPTSSEWSECQSHFFEELELVRPELIVTLGYLPSVILLGESPSPRLGVWGEYQGIPVMPTMHPNEILEGQTGTKSAAWRHLREFMRRAGLTPRK